jgi:GNAT superfamily N-acetyltransferase
MSRRFVSKPQRSATRPCSRISSSSTRTLVTRGSPATEDPADLDVAEFFVLRRYRRRGVGRHAAHALWDRLTGSWVVRVADRNDRGRAFWERVVSAYTGGRFCVKRAPGRGHEWIVYRFATRSEAGAAGGAAS